MKKFQAFLTLIFLLLLILVPCLLLSFFSIRALKNEESFYQRRLEIRYKTILQKIREQSRRRLLSEEKKIFRQKPFWEQKENILFGKFRKIIEKNFLFEYPFLIASTGKRIFPRVNHLISSSPQRQERIDQILNLAQRLEQEGKIETALDQYRYLAPLYKKQGEVHIQILFAMARCYAKLNHFSKSLSLYQILVRLYPLKDHTSLCYTSFQAWLEIGKIYKKTRNLSQFYKIYLKMLKFLIESKEAFSPSRFQKIKKQLLQTLANSKMTWVDKERDNLLKKEKIINRELLFFHLFDRRMLGYLAERIKGKVAPELAKIERRIALPSSPTIYGRLGHLKATSPRVRAMLFYVVIPHSQGRLILGAFIRREVFLNRFVTPKILQLGEDKEVQITLEKRGKSSRDPLAESTLAYPFENSLLLASLRDKQVFQHLSNLRVQNYILSIVIAVVLIGLGAIATMIYVFRQIRTAQLKSDFVSNVTHELKTPLTSIRMFVETMLMGRVNSREEELECLTIINKEAERLSHLIEKVLDFSSLENRSKSFRFSLCSVEEIISESIHLFKQQVNEGTCHFQLNMIQHIHPLRVDRSSIVEVMVNLFSNACKYSEKAAQITINLRESKKYVTIEVVDKGIGIPPKYQKKIFQKFYRVHNLLTSNEKGTGLGLAICLSIVKAHRGKILVESKPGEGSKFTVFLRR